MVFNVTWDHRRKEVPTMGKVLLDVAVSVIGSVIGGLILRLLM
jgi:hypothetical protein